MATIWIAKDTVGLFAYNHKPQKDGAAKCEECGQASVEFKGSLNVNCIELCEDVVSVLKLPKLKNGEAIEVTFGKVQAV